MIHIFFVRKSNGFFIMKNIRKKWEKHSKNKKGNNLPGGVSYCAESIFLGYHTALSQSSRGIILHWVNHPGYHTALSQSYWGIILCSVNLPRVSNCAESIFPGYHTALSQSSQGILLRCWVNVPEVSYCAESIFLKYQTALSQSSRVSYCTESISPGYHTALSQSPQSMRPRGVPRDPGEPTAISFHSCTGQCHKNYIPILLIMGYILHFRR